MISSNTISLFKFLLKNSLHYKKNVTQRIFLTFFNIIVHITPFVIVRNTIYIRHMFPSFLIIYNRYTLIIVYISIIDDNLKIVKLNTLVI